MECTACAGNGATRVVIEYTTDRIEQIALRADCRDAFRQGGFVETVYRTE